MVLSEQQTANSDKPWLFQPGQSGNPGGRPKGTISIVAKLRQYLAEHPDEVDGLVKGLVHLGIKPNPQQLGAIKETLDRIDGKVTQPIDVDMPIQLIFVPAQELLSQGDGDSQARLGMGIDGVIDGEVVEES